MKQIVENKSGYILVEELVYVALISLTVTIFTAFLVDIVRFGTRVTDKKEVEQAGRVVMARITQEIKTAKSITSLDTNSISLVNNDDTAIQFYLDADANVIYFNNGTETLPLSGDSVIADDMTFTAEGNAVIVSVDLENKITHNIPYQYHLSSAVIPRGNLY